MHLLAIPGNVLIVMNDRSLYVGPCQCCTAGWLSCGSLQPTGYTTSNIMVSATFGCMHGSRPAMQDGRTAVSIPRVCGHLEHQLPCLLLVRFHGVSPRREQLFQSKNLGRYVEWILDFMWITILTKCRTIKASCWSEFSWSLNWRKVQLHRLSVSQLYKLSSDSYSQCVHF